MNKRRRLVLMLVPVTVILLGARSCEIIAETDSDTYEIATKGTATIRKQWQVAYFEEAARISTCNDASECEAVPGTSCGCTRDLVANKNADQSHFRALMEAMGKAGCAIATVCDCPSADGYLCEDGRCAWNYL